MAELLAVSGIASRSIESYEGRQRPPLTAGVQSDIVEK